MFRLAEPWALLLIGVIPAWGVITLWRGRRAPGVLNPVLRRAAGSGLTWRRPAAWLPALCRCAAIVAFAYSLARPQELIPHSESTKDAVALQLVVDRSGSMDDPVIFRGERMNRLEAVKSVVRDFVLGDGDQLRGRAGDLLGLIVFGSYADTLMPLTQSHKALVDTLERVQVARDERERSTAIGDALVLANARLKASEDLMKEETGDPDFELKSKAIVLLTDGENRDGVYSPSDAARLAAEWDNRIYIIGIRGGATQLTNLGRVPIGQAVNEREMRAVAEYTGGQFWAVNDVSDLPAVYARIDELERTTIRVSETTEIRELYHRPATLGVLLLGLELLLRGLVGRRLP